MKIKKVILGTVLFIFDFIITGFVTCYLWNSVMGGIFGLIQITYWQGWALGLLIGYFKPKSWNQKSDIIGSISRDIVYTLLVAFWMWLLINFAGI